jgi:hypothetical protein
VTKGGPTEQSLNWKQIAKLQIRHAISYNLQYVPIKPFLEGEWGEVRWKKAKWGGVIHVLTSCVNPCRNTNNSIIIWYRDRGSVRGAHRNIRPRMRAWSRDRCPNRKQKCPYKSAMLNFSWSANLVPRACDPREGTWGCGIIRFREESDWPLKWNA